VSRSWDSDRDVIIVSIYIIIIISIIIIIIFIFLIKIESGIIAVVIIIDIIAGLIVPVTKDQSQLSMLASSKGMDTVDNSKGIGSLAACVRLRRRPLFKLKK
jgi:hypothetical protein